MSHARPVLPHAFSALNALRGRLVGALLAITLVLLGAASPASAANGTITGTLRAGGTATAGSVTVYRASDQGYITSTSIPASGEWSVSVAPAATSSTWKQLKSGGGKLKVTVVITPTGSSTPSSTSTVTLTQAKKGKKSAVLAAAGGA